MKFTFVEQTHRHGMRDPSWCFDFVQFVIYFGGGACCLAFLPSWLGIDPHYFTAVVILYAIPFFCWLYERRLDHLARPNEEKVDDSILDFFTLVGRPAQAQRILRGAREVRGEAITFRTGPGIGQQAVLVAVVFLVVPLLRMGGATISTMATVSCSVFGAIFVQTAIDRMRYRIDGDHLVLQRLFLWKVVETYRVPLAGAGVTCDFSEGVLHLMSSETQFSVPLFALFHPHRFAARLLACADAGQQVVGQGSKGVRGQGGQA